MAASKNVSRPGTLLPSACLFSVWLTRLRQRGERDEPAAVALAVGIEQLGVTGRAQARVLDAPRVDARLRQQLLVRPPEVEHHAAVRGRAGPAVPARGAEGARELAGHRLADLVAARADRRRDHRARASRARPLLPRRRRA